VVVEGIEDVVTYGVPKVIAMSLVFLYLNTFDALHASLMFSLIELLVVAVLSSLNNINSPCKYATLPWRLPQENCDRVRRSAVSLPQAVSKG